MKILVTGAAGFIGYHLSKSLLSRGYEVLGVDSISNYYSVNLKKDRLKNLIDEKNFSFNQLDITDRGNLSKIFENFKPDKVINMAAQPGVRYSIENPYEYISTNIHGFINVIELCKKNNVKGLIYASSSSVYGGNDKIPFSEIDNVNQPISIYAVSKISNELIAHTYSHLHGLSTTGLRFFTVYGPWYRPDMGIFIFTRNILNRKPIQLFNNGKMQRDFTYIDDIINGTISAVEKNYKCEIFNLGNNNSVSILDLIATIEKHLKISAIVDYAPLQKGDPVITFASIEHAQEKLNYNPKVKIDQGIPKFIDWYKNYYV